MSGLTSASCDDRKTLRMAMIDVTTSTFFPATALLEMGPRAKGAYPALAAQRGKGRDTRSEQTITNALKAIDPEAAARDGIH